MRPGERIVDGRIMYSAAWLGEPMSEPDIETLARRAALKLSLCRGDLGVLSPREASALAAVILVRLEFGPWAA